MHGKQLFQIIGRGEMPPRIPFVPTIFEHAARMIGSTPSVIARDEDLLVESQLACFEAYGHDSVAVGVDIYNVECEALGAKVVFPDNQELPSVTDLLVKCPEDVNQLKMPDPERDGRMPLFLHAVDRINRKIGGHVPVNGTIVGPFTLASILRGFEPFIMDMIFNPEFARDLLVFSRKVGWLFARALLKRGVGISINESWIAPPLLSPALYAEHVVQHESWLISEIHRAGQKKVALISGGNTTDIVQDMVKTGTTLLLADSGCDRLRYKEICREHLVLMRASISPKTVEEGNREQLEKETRQVVRDCMDYHGFLFGCGVVSYNTPPENVLLLKEILDASNEERKQSRPA